MKKLNPIPVVKTVPKKVSALERRHKTFIHLLLLAAIATSLLHEGGSAADWLFVALGFAVELA